MMKIPFSIFFSILLILIFAVCGFGQTSISPTFPGQPLIGDPLQPFNRLKYRDDLYPFTLIYPATWSQMPLNAQIGARLMIASGVGAGDANLIVNVASDGRLTGISPKQFVALAKAHPEKWRNALLAANPSSIVESSGTMSVANQPAHFVKSNFVTRINSTSKEQKMESLQIQTLFEGNLYTITCFAPADKFGEYDSIFKNIIASFTVAAKK